VRERGTQGSERICEDLVADIGRNSNVFDVRLPRSNGDRSSPQLIDRERNSAVQVSLKTWGSGSQAAEQGNESPQRGLTRMSPSA
jgi:hypothetical protein